MLGLDEREDEEPKQLEYWGDCVGGVGLGAGVLTGLREVGLGAGVLTGLGEDDVTLFINCSLP